MRFLLDAIRDIGCLLSRRTRDDSAAASRNAVAANANTYPLRLSLDAQWGRVTGVLEQAASRTAAMADAHAMAKQTWQAADYALDVLLEDLSAVMAVPTRSQRRALVPIDVRPVDIRRRRLAA